ncbi:MAG: hypothetical protein ACKO9D_08860 [Gammaproteobacteria bacterium]
MTKTPLRRGRLLAGLLLCAQALAGCLSGAGPEVPTITEQPKDRIGFVGQTVRFDVGVSGKPPMTFQWLRNGQAIAGETGIAYTTAKLTAADDGAKISVRITNAQGTVTSSEAALKVYGLPVITAQPTSVSAAVGASVSFSVTATGEQVIYQWLRDEIAVQSATSATYTISAVAAADDGVVFRVLVVNPAGIVASAPATLTVTAAPVVTVQPVGQTVAAGDPALFAVAATGGDLAYQWQRNGADIAGATGRVYRLDAAAAGDDSASFTARVTNPRGSVTSAAATLRVVEGQATPPPTPVAQVSLSRALAPSAGFTLVRRSDGSIAAWGYNGDGQFGNGTTGVATDTIATVSLPTGRRAVAVSAGENHALALLDNGDVYVWGGNDGGQLGLGDVVSRSTPTKVVLARPAVAVAAGRGFSVVALDDGRVFTWGINTIGQLGDGGRDAQASPVQAVGLTGIVAVSAGSLHVLALDASGRVWAWGANSAGQLGDGTFKPSRVPVATQFAGVARIRAGGDHSAAITSRRGLYLWGENGDGQLGLGTTIDAGVPVAVVQGVVDVAGSDRFTLLVGGDGIARAAGANESGSLGDGGTTARGTFGAVSTVSAGITVGAGGRSFSSAITASGTTFMWGDNTAKQLGNPSTTATSSATPTAVPNFDAIP